MGFYDKIMEVEPEKILEFSGWMVIPIEPSTEEVAFGQNSAREVRRVRAGILSSGYYRQIA